MRGECALHEKKPAKNKSPLNSWVLGPSRMISLCCGEKRTATEEAA